MIAAEDKSGSVSGLISSSVWPALVNVLAASIKEGKGKKRQNGDTIQLLVLFFLHLLRLLTGHTGTLLFFKPAENLVISLVNNSFTEFAVAYFIFHKNKCV